MNNTDLNFYQTNIPLWLMRGSHIQWAEYVAWLNSPLNGKYKAVICDEKWAIQFENEEDFVAYKLRWL